MDLSPRNLLHRLAVGALAGVLITGLWQGYGRWLLLWVRAHVA